MNVRVRVLLHKALELSRDQYIVYGLDCRSTPKDLLKKIVEEESNPPLTALNQEPESVLIMIGGKSLDHNKEFREQIECGEDSEYEVIIAPLLEGG